MSEPFLGEIKMVSFNFPPRGWAFCNGQLLPFNQNVALFSLLGTTYGGNGITHFALPNLQGRAPIHFGQGPGLPNYSQGEQSGEEAHTLTLNEMATHTHLPQGNSSPANAPIPVGNVWAQQTANPFHSTANVTMQATTTTATGGGEPHENLQPYLVINFIICLQGIFPSR